MKVEHGQSNVLGSANVGASSDFRINPSAQAFRILSSGLYSDKISAVLREIGCNASDAHIAAGKKSTPFEVKLPNTLDPHFYIKDFGPGLSDEEVRELYSTYFMSTKQTSNDFTGAFGLGSKSPFSYTDSFTVTSVKDGVQRVYTAHLNEQGSPAITLMTEGPADEDWPSGVSVGFPVRPGDFNEFSYKAANIYRFFSPIPNVLGRESKIEAPTFEVSTPHFMLKHTGDTNIRSSVVMGNVAYPLVWNNLGVSDVEAFRAVADPYRKQYKDAKGFVELQSLFAQLVNMGLVLKLPIGSVQVTASREAMEYDPKSRTALVEYLFQVGKELGEMLRDMVEDESVSLWERRIKARSFMSTDANGRACLDGDYLKALWRFAGLPEDRVEFFIDPVQSVPAWLGNHKVKAHFLAPSDARGKRAWSKPVRSGRFNNERIPALQINEKAAIIVADKPYANAHVKHAIEKGDFSTVVLLSASKSNQDLLAETVKQLQEYFGGVTVAKVSDLDPVTVTRYAYGGSRGSGAKTISRDARQVEVTYVLGDNAGSYEVMPLSEVPDTCRFYVIRETGRSRSQYYFSALAPCSPVLRMPESMMKNALTSLREAMEAEVDGVADLEIEGYIEVTEKEYARFKLAELGFAPLLNELAAILESDDVQAQFAETLSNLPLQNFSSNAGSNLVNALRKGGTVGTIVSEQLAGTRLGALLMAEAAELKPTWTPEQRALKELLYRWGGQLTALAPKSQALYTSALAKTNIESLVGETLPAWVQVIEASSYYSLWRTLCLGEAEPSAAMIPVIKALLVPAASAQVESSDAQLAAA